MKILHLLKHYPEHSGTMRAVQGQARGFALLGHDVEIWTSRNERDPGDAAAGINVRTIADGAHWSVSVIRKELRQRGRPDMVVLHGQFSPVVASTAVTLRWMKQPYIVCSHGVYHPAMLSRGRLKKWLYAPLERYALRGAAAVQLLAAKHIAHLEQFGVHNRTLVVPNGFDPAAVPTLPSRRPDDDRIRLLFLGRLDVHTKGLDLLLHAMEQQARKHNLRLTLIGPAWRDVDALKSQAAALADAVEFCTADYSRHPAQIISGYDVLILPSRHEGFGLSALEAMAAGVPVIVSTESGIAEHVAVARAGWLCEPTVDSISKTLSSAVSERAAWKAMGMRGRDYAHANLTWSAISARAVKLYEELCSASGKINRDTSDPGRPPRAGKTRMGFLTDRPVSRGFVARCIGREAYRRLGGKCQSPFFQPRKRVPDASFPDSM